MNPVANTAVESDVLIHMLVSVCAPGEIEEAFSYDLAHFCPPLYLDNGKMRPVKKADLGNHLKGNLVNRTHPRET